MYHSVSFKAYPGESYFNKPVGSYRFILRVTSINLFNPFPCKIYLINGLRYSTFRDQATIVMSPKTGSAKTAWAYSFFPGRRSWRAFTLDGRHLLEKKKKNRVISEKTLSISGRS